MPPKRTSKSLQETKMKSELVEDVKPPVRRNSKRGTPLSTRIIATRTKVVKSTTNGSYQESLSQDNFVAEFTAQSNDDANINEHIDSLSLGNGDSASTADNDSFESSSSKHSCSTCHKSFTRKSHLDRHQKHSCGSDSPKFTCTHNQCNASFTRQDNLNAHIHQKHSKGGDCREKKHKCDTCHKMFPTSSLLQKHNRTHTGECPFKCGECPMKFNDSGALKNHSRIHTGEKPYKCSGCEKTFARQGTLSRHLMTHTGRRPHKCKHCDKEFIQSGGLKAHMFFHTGENGFKCDMCDRQFNRKARLEMHKRYKHEKVKPFPCSLCDKSFTRKEDLNRHSILHTGEKPHKCVYCNKSFPLKASLNVHLLTHRKSLLPDAEVNLVMSTGENKGVTYEAQYD